MIGKNKESKDKARKVEIEPEEEIVQAEGEEVVEENDQLDFDIAAFQVELDQLRKDAEESRDHYLRILAEFDNFRKRQREDGVKQAAFAREDMMGKLLPIVDNFQRALKAAEEQHSYDSLVEGVSLTQRQLMDMLAREGMEPIEAVGQQFDPELHEAMMRVETDEYPENTVIDEFETGYTFKGRVVRPSRVRVAVASE